jgi:hypothetical protein
VVYSPQLPVFMFNLLSLASICLMDKQKTQFVRTTLGILASGFLLVVSACTAAGSTTTPATIRIQYTSATQPWLVKLDECAGPGIVSADLRSAAHQEIQSADLVMRLGQPKNLSNPVWQIGTDELLIIVHPNNPVTKLTTDQVRGLFSGQIQNWKDLNGSDSPARVWVFPKGEDLQQIFDEIILRGSPTTSLARLANNPTEMVNAISSDTNAIGILTRKWLTEGVLAAFTAESDLPVLAITQAEPEGALATILACMQK